MLDSLPYPERPDNHFVVDPDKFDYYSMDCYRLVEDDQMAEMLAQETLRKVISPTGEVLSPMRKAEAEITLGVVASRRGDLDLALKYGREALSIDRRSRPSLLMVGGELDRSLQVRFPRNDDAVAFHHELATATQNVPAVD